jgi:hypothetical protein
MLATLDARFRGQDGRKGVSIIDQLEIEPIALTVRNPPPYIGSD